MLYHSWLALHAVGYSTIESPTWCVCCFPWGEPYDFEVKETSSFCGPPIPYMWNLLRWSWPPILENPSDGLDPTGGIRAHDRDQTSVSFCHFIFVIYLVLKWIDGSSDCMILTVQFWAVSVNIMNSCSIFFPSNRIFFVPQWMVHPMWASLWTVGISGLWGLARYYRRAKLYKFCGPSVCKLYLPSFYHV